ncbi:MAG: 3-hydroxyisobutyrate dehydrogenase [Pseudomonadota bacterium]
MATIGFIGLGNMGLPMATNLVNAGHEVAGFDSTPEVLENAKMAGVITCAHVTDAVEGAEAIITMLPNGAIVLSVLQEIIPACEPGTLLIDCSTVDVGSARKAHEMASEAGMGAIDCPVSGGISGAAAGTLTFMIGGSEENCKRAKPFLDIMGAKQVRCGDGGAGQAAKICNNMLLATTMISVGEAFSLGSKLGLEAQALYDVMSTSSGSCWSINTYCPVPGVGPQSPSDNGYQPGFASSLMVKDTSLAQEAAIDVGQATPLGAHALDLYKQFSEEGGADMDFSGIITWLEKKQRG